MQIDEKMRGFVGVCGLRAKRRSIIMRESRCVATVFVKSFLSFCKTNRSSFCTKNPICAISQYNCEYIVTRIFQCWKKLGVSYG